MFALGKSTSVAHGYEGPSLMDLYFTVLHKSSVVFKSGTRILKLFWMCDSLNPHPLPDLQCTNAMCKLGSGCRLGISDVA